MGVVVDLEVHFLPEAGIWLLPFSRLGTGGFL